MLETDIIQKNLENTFDIPFTVNKTFAKGEPVFWLAPEDPGKELFTIQISFRNHVRLIMDFIPQKYSVGFIRSMGEKKGEARENFGCYYQLMKKKGARGSVKINGNEIDPEETSSLPEDWDSFEARITKMPISEDDEPDYPTAVKEWGSLMMGMILSLADIVPIEPEDVQRGYAEGNVKKSEIRRYERNPLNRKLCIEANGCSCAVCGFDFEKKYGELGRGFIHVHHIIPVSQMGAGYVVNPIKDLIPVCPNCHAMLHRTTPPLKPEQLKSMIRMNRMAKVYYEPTRKVSMVAESETDYGNKAKN